MLAPTVLALTGDRLTARYLIAGDEERAKVVVDHLRVEQTIEFPLDLVPDDDIRDHLVARLEELTPGPGGFHAQFSFAVEVSGFSLPQLTNMLFGNISLLPGVRLLEISLPASVLTHFRGPRFGTEGLRSLMQAPDRPLVATALKPMGTPLEQLADNAEVLVRGGVDLIKDDHGLADQSFAPFRRRVELIARRVAAANAVHGRHAIYLPSLNVRADQLGSAARFARDAGARGVMFLPGLHGFDAMRAIADDDDLDLVVMAHPSMLGSYLVDPSHGISHRVLLGTLARLAGADVVVFPGSGGRFGVPVEQCAEIVSALREPLGTLRQSFPAPAGGMTLTALPDVVAQFGADVAPLIGGDLYRGELLLNAHRMRSTLVDAAVSHVPTNTVSSP